MRGRPGRLRLADGCQIHRQLRRWSRLIQGDECGTAAAAADAVAATIAVAVAATANAAAAAAVAAAVAAAAVAVAAAAAAKLLRSGAARWAACCAQGAQRASQA